VASVTFDGVGKVYPDGTRAVQDLELDVADGEFLVFVGPSGCGKTTALRMVAGLEEITEGTISIGDTVINDVVPQKRNIAMVFQNYALYPHMNVADNIGFGLRMRNVPKREIRARVEEIARVLRLSEFLDRRPRVLSGGQRQRVAMGRAIIRDPSVLLMDEPLSNLDAKLRVQMRAEIARIQREIRATTIYVTHDQIEAMTMGDRVVVMRKGRIQQVDLPQTIYERPANLFVATFIGSPPMNLLRAQLERDGGDLVCRIGSQRLSVPEETVAALPALAGRVGETIAVGIRPEHVRDAADAPGAPPGRRLRGQVVATELLGSDMLVHLEIDAEPVLTAEVIEIAADIDAATVEELQEEAAKSRTPVLCRFDAHSRIAVDDTVEIVLATERMHFFDLATGEAIGGGPIVPARRPAGVAPA
jgi:multiple sugar transport system ATP-binding protein